MARRLQQGKQGAGLGPKPVRARALLEIVQNGCTALAVAASILSYPKTMTMV